MFLFSKTVISSTNLSNKKVGGVSFAQITIFETFRSDPWGFLEKAQNDFRSFDTFISFYDCAAFSEIWV